MKTYNTYYENIEDLRGFLAENSIEDSTSILVQVFTSVIEMGVLIKMLSEINSVFKLASVIGSTTDGEILNDCVSTTKTVMSVSVFENSTLEVGFEDGYEDSFFCGKNLAKKIVRKDTKALILFSDGLHMNGEFFLDGVQSVSDDIPLVCDMSSNILDKVIDFNKFGVIYAGAQKNIGPAGVTLVIVREDLLDRVPEKTPTMQKWKTHSEKDSLFNTAPCWSIYMCKLSLEYLKQKGGISAIEKINRKKAKLLYDFIDKSNGFYKGYAVKDSRSLMNVTFNLPTKDLEEKCVNEGSSKGLLGLKGHRSVGGMRASIYNAMTIEGVKKLIEFLNEFQEKNQ